MLNYTNHISCTQATGPTKHQNHKIHNEQRTTKKIEINQKGHIYVALDSDPAQERRDHEHTCTVANNKRNRDRRAQRGFTLVKPCSLPIFHGSLAKSHRVLRALRNTHPHNWSPCCGEKRRCRKFIGGRRMSNSLAPGRKMHI